MDFDDPSSSEDGNPTSITTSTTTKPELTVKAAQPAEEIIEEKEEKEKEKNEEKEFKTNRDIEPQSTTLSLLHTSSPPSLTTATRNVQSLVFEGESSDADDDDDNNNNNNDRNMIFVKRPEAVDQIRQHAGINSEELHHQLVKVNNNSEELELNYELELKRPQARDGWHGDAGSSGRLGCRVSSVESLNNDNNDNKEENEYEEDFVEEEEEIEEEEYEEEVEEVEEVEEEFEEQEEEYEEQEEEYEEEEGDDNNEGLLLLSSQDSVTIEKAKEWDSVLGPMTILDITPVSCFYVGYDYCWAANGNKMDEPAYGTETMVKVISPFFKLPIKQTNRVISQKVKGNKEEEEEEEEAYRMSIATLQSLASHMRLVQKQLGEKGLTLEGQLQFYKKESDNDNDDEEEEEEYDDLLNRVDVRKIVCRVAHSIHVDSSCRLIGVIDVDACAVSLSDVLAFTSHPFSQQEIISILKSIVNKVCALHEAGFIHGCLHSGNVLCSTDDGRTLLTGACGIMSNPFFPTDPSFISPRLALEMQPLMELIFNYYQEEEKEKEKEKLENSNNMFSWTSNPTYHRWLLELYGCTKGTGVMQATFSDDIYAIGILTISCLLGVPPFHSVKLKEIVEILAPHYRDNNSSSLLGAIFSSNYVIQRFKFAGYSEDFIDVAHDFVDFCLTSGMSGNSGTQDTIKDLLLHPFFASYRINQQLNGNFKDNGELENQEEEIKNNEEMIQIDRTIHCLVYPIFTAMDFAKKNCGTTPLISRLYRNSIFASRTEAIKCSLLYSGRENDINFISKDLVGIMWPYLNKEIPSWGISNYKETVNWTSLLYRSSSSSSLTVTNSNSIKNTELIINSKLKGKGIHIDNEAHTLFYIDKSNEHIILNRDEFTPYKDYLNSFNILILSDLQDCTIEILLTFRFVLLRNLRRCKVFLSPCYSCYCENVVDCNPISITSAYLLIDNVFRVNFQYSGYTLPRCLKGDSHFGEISIIPYCISYAGVSSEFAAIPLPQEHSSSMIKFSNNSETINETIRMFQLYNIMQGDFDYPYSHALAAFGTRFIHEDDNLNDVFLFFSEITGKSIRIARINGGNINNNNNSANYDTKKESLLLSDVTHSSLWRNYFKINRETHSNNNSENYPVIFIMDIVGDCVIEDCSFCTIIILGSTESITIRRCSQIRLFLMARELLFEDCELIDVYMFVTELILLDHCNHMNLFPLSLEAPHIIEILTAIIDGCAEESLHELLENSLRQKDINNLNALIRSENDTNAIDMDECEDIEINTLSNLMFLINFIPSEAPVSKFFFEAYNEERSEEDWEIIPLLNHIWDKSNKTEISYQENLLTSIRLHDLISVSLLRLPETLNPRLSLFLNSSTTNINVISLVDVVLERLVMGVIHIRESLGTLFIQKCIGPLDIVVCASTNVIIASCEYVTLQTSCCNFIAKNCHSCHFALHINTPPLYEACTNIQSSTLNITTEDFEEFLKRCGIKLDINKFSEPIFCKVMEEEEEEGRGRGIEEEEEEERKKEESNSIISSSNTFPFSIAPDCINSLNSALATLYCTISLVPPLPATCLGVNDAPFMGFLEDNVNREETSRIEFETKMINALTFIASRFIAKDNSVNVIDDTRRFIRSPSPAASLKIPEKIKEQHVDPSSIPNNNNNIDNNNITAPVPSLTNTITNVNNNNNNNNNNDSDINKTTRNLSTESLPSTSSHKTIEGIQSEERQPNTTNSNSDSNSSSTSSVGSENEITTAHNNEETAYHSSFDTNSDNASNNNNNNNNDNDPTTVREPQSLNNSHINSSTNSHHSSNNSHINSSTISHSPNPHDNNDRSVDPQCPTEAKRLSGVATPNNTNTQIEEIENEEIENELEENIENEIEEEKEKDLLTYRSLPPEHSSNSISPTLINGRESEGEIVLASASPPHSTEEREENEELQIEENEENKKEKTEENKKEKECLKRFYTSELIIAVHPDDAEAVQSIMCRVNNAREAFEKAREGNRGISSATTTLSSIEDLQRRVEQAVARLQDSLK